MQRIELLLRKKGVLFQTRNTTLVLVLRILYSHFSSSLMANWYSIIGIYTIWVTKVKNEPANCCSFEHLSTRAFPKHCNRLYCERTMSNHKWHALIIYQGCNLQVWIQTRFQTWVRVSLHSHLARNGRSGNQNWPGMGSAGFRLGADSSRVHQKWKFHKCAKATLLLVHNLTSKWSNTVN